MLLVKKQDSSYQTKLIITLLLVYFVWGSTYLGVKIALHTLPPLLLAGIRFALGGAILFVITLIRGYKLPTLEEFKGGAYVGFLLSGIGNGCVAYAIKFIPSGLVALLVATLPAWMILLDYLFFRHQKPSILALVGIVAGLVGMVVMFDPFSKASVTEIALFPAFIVFVGEIAWAYGSLKSPYLTMPKGLQSTAVQMFVGGSFLLILSLFTESNQVAAIQSMTTETYLTMAYLIFVGSFIGYTSYIWLINNAPTQITATYAYVNPVVAIFLGWLFVGEKLSFNTLVASSIILTGVILMTLGRKK